MEINESQIININNLEVIIKSIIELSEVKK